MSTKKLTNAERIAVVEVKMDDTREEINHMHKELQGVDTKLDGVVLTLATFQTSFTDFLDNGLPQRVGEQLADHVGRRARAFKLFLYALATVVTLGSLIVAVVALMTL